MRIERPQHQPSTSQTRRKGLSRSQLEAADLTNAAATKILKYPLLQGDWSLHSRNIKQHPVGGKAHIKARSILRKSGLRH